jgi:hypothetical protein
MDRRKFLTAILGPIVLTPGIEEGSWQAEVQPKEKYILFADPDAMGDFTPPDDIEVTVVMVKPRADQNMDDCVRLYRLSGNVCGEEED